MNILIFFKKEFKWKFTITDYDFKRYFRVTLPKAYAKIYCAKKIDIQAAI